MRLSTSGAASIATLIVALGCDESSSEPRTPQLARYVALGNSITAGYQSGGIDDATQRRAYPALIARQAGVPYAFASMGAGCPAPISSLLDGLAGAGDRPCTVAGQHPGRRLLNNVAVPGADSFDPTDLTPDTDDLTALILDGENQVDKALEETPTFVTVWIGNNDVLGAAIDGIATPAAITDPVVFGTNFDAIVGRLSDAGVSAGVFVGVADVTQIPLLIPASALARTDVRVALNAATGKTVAIHASCTASTVFISLGIVAAIASDAHPATVTCTPTQPGGVGDQWVLTNEERAAIQSAVTAYNAHIAAAAAARGFVYYDPNPLFAAARAAGEIPEVPDPFSSQPFGVLFSLDGVHPSNEGHVRIANELIDAINARYATGIPRNP